MEEKQFEVFNLNNEPINEEFDSVQKSNEIEKDNNKNNIINEDHTLDENKSVDVYNALNICCEELGSLYETEGYNPFDKDFKLTEEFTQDILSEKRQKGDVNIETFLEQNNKKIARCFNCALENNNMLIDKLSKELENIKDPKVKKQMKKMLITLKNRSQLLKMNITKLKQKDADAIKMYIELFGQDNELNELLKDGYTEKINLDIVVQKINAIALQRASMMMNNDNFKSDIQIDREINNALNQNATIDNQKANEQVVNQNAKTEKITQNEKQNNHINKEVNIPKLPSRKNQNVTKEETKSY